METSHNSCIAVWEWKLVSGTVPPFLRGARDAMEIICTADTGSIMCFSAVSCWMEREVLIGSNVYMKSGRLKGSFPMYESMKCQNSNPEDNHIVPNKKFLFLQHGKRLLFQRLYMKSKKATAFSPLVFKLHSNTFPLDWKVAQLKRIFFYQVCQAFWNLCSQQSLFFISWVQSLHPQKLYLIALTEKSKLICIILNCALEWVLLSDCKQQTFSVNVTLPFYDA